MWSVKGVMFTGGGKRQKGGGHVERGKKNQ